MRAIAALMLLLTATPSLADKLPTSDPLAQLLIRADKDRDFVVTLAEADAAIAELYEGNSRDATASWARTLRFIGLPPETRTFLPSQHVAAVLAMLDRVDAAGNKDGVVDREEVNAEALAQTDEDLRQDMLDLFEVADADRDGNVTREEREALVKAAEGKDDKPLSIDEILEGVRADAANDARLVADLFSKHGSDGNLKLSDVME